MQEKSPVEKGWEFSSCIMGTNVATSIASTNGAKYVKAIEEAIKELEANINEHHYRNQGIPQLQGYMLEEWAAGTMNINAVAAGSKDPAIVLHENGLNSVDIHIESGKDYSAKSYATGARTAKEQAGLNLETRMARYHKQGRLVPTDQLSEAKTVAGQQALRNAKERPDVAAAYSDTEGKLTDVITNKDGIESKPATRKELEKIAKESKEQSFEAKKHGITVENSIQKSFIIQQALKAGYTAAIITAVTQIAPEIYKTLDYLIKNGELRLEDILHIGEKGISGAAEGFMRGSVSSSLGLACQSGLLGESIKMVSPEILATMVTLTMQTIKNSILVAAGKMTPQQMGAAFAESLVVSSGYLLGAKIGGVIGQALLNGAPVVGYLLGSLVGTAFSVVYNIGKKKLISFCVDTGFTCFGLVEQDYQLPEEVLNSMGINTIKISQTPIHQTRISTTQISQAAINRQSYETIGFTMPRRGIIGVNKVGYVV